MTRHARQTILPEVGTEGQARLAASHVLIVGLGGLGVPVLQYLAGAGVGRLTLVDGDRIEVSNLHRQPIYRPSDAGRRKVEAARDWATRFAPEVVVETVPRFLTPSVLADLLPVSVACDCADSYAVSYMMSDACLAAGVPLISASALGMSGYVGGFCGGAPSLRALFPEPPDQVQTCATAGVLGPVVGAIGALQAQMALSCLLGLTPSPLGQMVSLDARTFRPASFRFDRAEESLRPLRFLSPGDIRPSDTVIDLRPESESAPVTPDAIRLLPDELDLFTPPDTRLILACRSGLRAWRAGRKLQSRWGGEICLVADIKDIP